MNSTSSLHILNKEKWQELAPQWMADPEGINRHCREGLLDAILFEELGEIQGKRVLDLGCGDGRFGHLLAQKGAFVTGVDQCEAFIAHANQHKINDHERYEVGDAHQLAQLADATFDRVVSYISLVDIVDMNAAVKEVCRVLKLGGRFIVCNMHPVLLAGSNYLKDNVTGKTLFDLSRYFHEGPITFEIYGTKLSSFHRTLSTHLQIFFKHHFQLENLREPRATPAQIQQYPGLGNADQLPLFIVYSLRTQ